MSLNDLQAPSSDIANLKAEAFKQALCYSLPYGTLGFASHLITYYTMIILILGRRPSWPWLPLEYPTFGAIFGLIQLIGTTVLTLISISSCEGEKPFRLMGAWMLMTSIAAGITSIAAPYAFGTTRQEVKAKKLALETRMRERRSFDMLASARMEGGGRKFPVPVVEVQAYVEDPASKRRRERGGFAMFWVAIIWVAGSIMGVYGVILFCNGRWNVIKTLNTVTAVFSLAVFWPAICFCLMGKKALKVSVFVTLFVAQLFMVCSLGLLWMDWTIAAMTGNLLGVPQNHGVLAWIYFALKRLPMFAI